jgi:HD superfamily phosphohydrolase
MLRGENASEGGRVLQSLLSGPIDIDKMDYLARDSLHAGVPYGRNFDQARLIGSLCLNEAGNALAITEKGRTAAEMMVFARYVMFSEVYWHHTVRSATAMIQRAFYELRNKFDLAKLLLVDEYQLQASMLHASQGTSAEGLVRGLFGTLRQLYKRLDQYSLFQHPEVYQQLARRPYEWLVECGNQFGRRLGHALGSKVTAEQVLIDAPPQKREIEIDIDVYFPKEDRYRRLVEVSPVVQTLAEKQFDDYVKRVRIIVAPELARAARGQIDCVSLLRQAIADVDHGAA